MLMNDSNGNKSWTHTMSVIAFFIVMLKVLFDGVTVTFGTFTYSFGMIDSFSIAAILGPTVGAYVVRHHDWNGGDSGGADVDGAGSKPNAGAE